MNSSAELVAALVNTRPDAGGILTATLGLACSVFGVSFALNFRGWTDRWYEQLSRIDTPRLLRRIPPWRWSGSRDTKIALRVYVWFFAILGPILLVVGISRIASGNL